MLKRNVTLMVLAVSACLAQSGLRSLAPEQAGAPPAPVAQGRSGKIEQSLLERASGPGSVRVFVALSEQLDRTRVKAIRAAHSAQVRAFDGEARSIRGTDTLASGARFAAAARRDEAITAERQEIARYARETYAPQQNLMESRIQALGGRVLDRFSAANLLYVEIPADALHQVAAFGEVAGIFESRRKQPNLMLTTKVLGAPVLWDTGYTGGTQTVAVIDSGIASTHPGFKGLKIDVGKQVSYALASGCAAETNPDGEDRVGHGTHVSGIVASRGTSDLPDLKGVAYGLRRLVAIKVGVLGLPTPDCPDLVIEEPDVLRALETAVIDGAPRVVNLSLGGEARSDDALANWVIDKLCDDYDVTIVIAAANNGLTHYAYQLGDLALSYNALAVANLDPHGTVSRSDDTIHPSSSSGPTPLGRRKPDIAAPGTYVVSLLPGNQYGALTGTSMAAPHIAGAAALLYDLGVGGAREVKALLINTADALGWSARAGWGSANLKTAYAQANAVESASIRSGGAHYYQVPVDGTLSATLVWNRHIETITPDGSHAFGDFRNLNLAAYNADTNQPVATSSSKIDNVEKLFLGGSGTALIKVTDVDTDDAQEEFALAFSSPDYKEVTAGKLNVQCTGTDEVSATMKVTVSCTMRNTGGLPVFAVTPSFSASAGFSAAGLSSFDRVDPGASKPFTFTVSTPGSARGANAYSLMMAGIAYGDQIGDKAALSVNVRAPQPQDCTPSIDPAPGTLELTGQAQSFVMSIRFPGYNPQEPGACSWSAFTAGAWYWAAPPLGGTGDGKLVVNVVASPMANVSVHERSGNVRLTIKGDGSGTMILNYALKQLYR
jgi:subtilisin family serine protease